MAPASPPSGFQSFTPLPTIKLGPSGAGSRVGVLVHALGPMWVSPMTSPVRLGVSPSAAPTPMGAFNQRFEALFPYTGALGCAVCFAPCHSSWFICARMWGHGLLPSALPAPFLATLSPALSVYLRECGAAGSSSVQTAWVVPPTLRQSGSRHGNESPLCPGAHLCPALRSGCIFLFIYLVSHFLAVQFSVSSGCARRRSVSTYAAILILLPIFNWVVCVPGVESGEFFIYFGDQALV